MAPKTGKGKGAAKDIGGTEPPENESAVRRTQLAYFPSMVDAVHLKNFFLPLWGRKTTGHPATRVIPADCNKGGSKRYPFFVDFFFCRLCPPFSDFFNDIMHTFSFYLLDLTPNAVACLAHLCEGFAGVVPSMALFCHYFYPRVQPGGALSRSVSWILRTQEKGAYPEGAVKESWDECRGRWCWISKKDPPEFCWSVRQEPLTRN